MSKLFSIVRIVKPGAFCSYPVGRCEVDHLSAAAGQTDEMMRRHAESVVETLNRRRALDRGGWHYELEEYERDDDPNRAPTERMMKDAAERN